MRFGVILAAVAALTLGVPGAHAATTWFGIHAGTALPQGPFKDDAKNGFGGEVALNHMFNGSFGIGGRIAMNNWDATDEINTAAEGLFGPGSKVTFNTWSYSLFGIATLPLSGPVAPYVRAGGGLFNPRLRLDMPGGFADETNDEWGYLAGGGVNVQVRPGFHVGVDATWQSFDNGFTDENTSWVDVRMKVLMHVPNFDPSLR